MSPNPLVSVIVPSFNQGRFIRKTLESILSQDYRPLEIIVVDGASTDETVSILQEYDNVPEVNWISEPDSGVVEAVNKGFERARGEIGAIQSSDDYYLPGAIRQATELLMNNPDFGLVYGDIIKVDHDGNDMMKYVLKAYSLENVLSMQTWIPQPSCFFRLALAKKIGGWRDSVPYAADTDMWLRILIQADAKKVDVFWAKRRMHKDQRDVHGDRIINDYSQVITDFFEIFKAPEHLIPAATAGLLLKKNRYSYGEDQAIKQERIREALKIYPPLHLHFSSSSKTKIWNKLYSIARKLMN